MALDLIDHRTKLSLEAHCAIAAHARAHGLDKPEVSRQIIEEWAQKQIHGARMLHMCLRAKGLTAAAEGIVGADQGSAGKSSLDWTDE